jgi:CAAD domains of cyanobacterial aminoacyl-tRNA synthetase
MTQANFSDETETITEVAKLEMMSEEPGDIATVTTPETSTAQFQDIKDQVVTILSELPDYLSNFFGEYQKPIVTIGLIVAGGITIKVTLGVIDTLNDVPLLAPFFELVGIGYTAWFVYRYMLQASTRQELLAEIASLKEQVLGQDS